MELQMLDITGQTLVQIQPGIYSIEEQPKAMVVHFGKLFEALAIPDNQQARASIYGTLMAACKKGNLDLLIVRESGVPSIAEVAYTNSGASSTESTP
jgi:hypothetical protein